MVLSARKYRPSNFVPTTSFTGEEDPRVFRGENIWLRTGRFGTFYGEGYSGNRDLGQTIPTKTLTGTISWTADVKTLTGSGTAFLSELHLGCFVLGDPGIGSTELFIIESIESDTSATLTRAPNTTSSNEVGYILPVAFPVGTGIGTAIRGNVVSFLRGHYLGVGDGTFRYNGNALTNSLDLTKTPTFALYDPITDQYVINTYGIEKMTTPVTLAAVSRLPITGATAASPIQITSTGHGLPTGTKVRIEGIIGVPEANGTFVITNTGVNTFTLDGTTGTGAYVSGGYVWPSQMRAGDYNIRVCRANTGTLGFSQPTDIIGPITLAANQSIRVTFNEAMVDDQDAYDIYSSEFLDNSTATIEARYQGPWYKVKRVTASDLIDGSHATGRETGTSHVFSFADSEISGPGGTILSFDNFPARPAEFVVLQNGIPIFFSCQGKSDASNTDGKSPGPVAIPAKPSNPEAVFLNKSFTMADGDTIIGVYNAKGRIFSLGQNTLQNVVLTTIDVEPIAFRSLWSAGFRNPYNLAFVKEYLYAASTHGIIRSVAGGDDTAVEFEFATDVQSYVAGLECGGWLVAYDPKNKAMCYFYSAYERRSGYFVTLVLPFLVEVGIWSMPIILSKANTDFVVSGVATVGSSLFFLAGGKTSGGTIEVNTYEFDGGDSETKDWYIAWPFTDEGEDFRNKRIKGANVTGSFNSANTEVKIYRVAPDEEFPFDDLEDGTNETASIAVGSTGGLQKRVSTKFTDSDPGALFAVRVSGSYTTKVDRIDEVALIIETNSSPM